MTDQTVTETTVTETEDSPQRGNLLRNIVLGILALLLLVLLVMGIIWLFRQISTPPVVTDNSGVVAPVSGNVVPRFCNAVIVGIPVTEKGKCSWCTINYAYDPSGKNPGDVYIVSEEPMEYEVGAYVYQYSDDRFRECIADQAFITDPGYTPVYK
jgi:hypothetical protein